MDTKFTKSLKRFTHDTALYELKRLYSHDKKSVLSYHDTLYLNIIEAHPNKYTSSKIADLLNITRPSVTEKINQLCKKGYIIRTQSDHDKRVFYLSINPNAPKDYEISAGYEEMIEQAVVSKFGTENTELLCQMIDYLSDMMIDQMEEDFKHE